MKADTLTLSLSVAVRTFLLDCTSRRLSVKTLRFYEQQLSYFFTFLETAQGLAGDKTLASLERNQIRSYLVSLHERGLSGSSQDAAYRTLNAFCEFCVAEGWLDISPMANVKRPKVGSKIPPAFSQDEVKQILAACTTRRDRAIIYFLLDSGVRAQELLDVNVRDVDQETGSVTINHGKGNKQRVTYLGARARKELSRYLIERGSTEPQQPLFMAHGQGGKPHSLDGRLAYNGLKQLMRRLERDTGIEVYAHKFRHTCARWSLRSGMNIYALRLMMGHTSLEMLKQYAQLEEADLGDAHRRYGAVDNML